MQLLLYTPAISPRLEYTCHLIFKEIMQVDFLITTDLHVFKNNNAAKIKYSNEAMDDGHLSIGNCGLLFETGIREQDTRCFEADHYPAFFKRENADLAFDILSASFFLISRYEEYLPHTKDSYGRYAHENSLAYRENFLHLPLVNIWVNHLTKKLQEKFPFFISPRLPFRFLPTYDIDMAFSYRHKGWLRNLGGFLKSPSLKRVQVLLELSRDPFDCYNQLNEWHSQLHLHPLYFFLLAARNGKYDKNILPQKKAMRKLVLRHAQQYTTGIHPSWQSGDNPVLLIKEKECLENISYTTITRSRQHYIRFNLPDGYRQLTAAGITDDYSMGYGSINGFRASVAASYHWFDLQKNQTGLLRIHPFCFMDANSLYEQKHTPAMAYNELVQFYTICKETGGQLITIWHNNFLGNGLQFEGWKEIYLQFILGIEKESVVHS